MKPSEITVSLKGLVDGYTAPEIIREHACDEWRRAASKEGLELLAFQEGDKVEEGRQVVAWLVDQAEDMYLLWLDVETLEVRPEYHQKAQRL